VSRTIDIGPPNARYGYISDIGATSAAQHWGFAAGGATETQNQFVAIINEAPGPVTVDVTTPGGRDFASLPGLHALRIPRGARAFFRLADHGGQPDTPMIINATGAVVVQRSIYRGTRGASAVMGTVLSTDHG
jgi:hypothetical protein